MRLLLQSIIGKPNGVQVVLYAITGGASAPMPKQVWYDCDETNLPAAWVGPITSDAEGHFAVSGVPAGCGVFLRTNPDERFAPQDLMLNTGTAEQRGQGDRTYRATDQERISGEELVLPLSPAQWFEGQVTYADTGRPAPERG